MSAQTATVKARKKTDRIPLPGGFSEIVITPLQELSEDEYFQFCVSQRELRIEMTSEGQMIIMMPVGGEGSHRNLFLTGRFFTWSETDPTGILCRPCFDVHWNVGSSTGKP